MNVVIKQLRITKGLTQQQLALRTGLQQSTICRIEQNCENTSWGKILKILVALKIDIHYFTHTISRYNYNKLYEFMALIIDQPNIRRALIADPQKVANKLIQWYAD